MQAELFEIMNSLRNLSLSAVNHLQSDETRLNLSVSLSPTDLESRVAEAFDSAREEWNHGLDTVQRQVLVTIPSDQEGRRIWERDIFPNITSTLENIKFFFNAIFLTVVAFFSGLWNKMKEAFVWVLEEVVAFFQPIKDRINSIFQIFF